MVSTWALTGLPDHDFGLYEWPMMILGALGCQGSLHLRVHLSKAGFAVFVASGCGVSG